MKFLHRIFTVEIKLLPFSHCLFSPCNENTTVNVEFQFHRGAASFGSLQAGGPVRQLPVILGWFLGGFAEEVFLSSEIAPLADSILGLELRKLGGISNDLKLILHRVVFPLCPGARKGDLGGWRGMGCVSCVLM